MSRKRDGAPRRTGTGTVRIIGGSLRGSKLAVPDSAGLRPTPDRVRETLFNWLQPVIAGARCLDLFAGSLWAAVADRLERSAWLAPQGWIYVESPLDAQLRLPARWRPHRESRAGQVRHALYRRATADPLS
jgi:16S rRNA G966 N2-methylase RsmD